MRSPSECENGAEVNEVLEARESVNETRLARD